MRVYQPCGVLGHNHVPHWTSGKSGSWVDWCEVLSLADQLISVQTISMSFITMVEDDIQDQSEKID